MGGPAAIWPGPRGACATNPRPCLLFQRSTAAIRRDFQLEIWHQPKRLRARDGGFVDVRSEKRARCNRSEPAAGRRGQGRRKRAFLLVGDRGRTGRRETATDGAAAE